MFQHGLLDQSLYLLAMNRKFRQFSFDRECRRNSPNIDLQRQNLFIAGMARAGSTALLNTIYASGQFAATTYALMPFVLAPSMARQMSSLGKKNVATKERAHGDGIQVSVNSPEALDGIFWSTHLPTLSETIQPLSVPSGILRKYAMHIENLLSTTSTQRYLCKMNQSIDKLESLATFFTQSTFLIPFRDPLQQATSLLRQHHRFSNLSWYEKRYMQWQQHYEFGDLHRGFGLDSIDATPDSLDYWLDQWRRVYRYLSELERRYDNLILLRYESVTSSTLAWQQLSRRLNLDLETNSYINHNREIPACSETCDPALLDSSRHLYNELGEQFETRLCA